MANDRFGYCVSELARWSLAMDIPGYFFESQGLNIQQNSKIRSLSSGLCCDFRFMFDWELFENEFSSYTVTCQTDMFDWTSSLTQMGL